MLGEGLRAGLAHLGRAHRTIAYIEREAYAAAVLAARMEEGSLDGAPIWPDLLTFDGAAWRGAVDCIAAGFPCQDLSLAGRRAGLDGARSGLFFDICDIADACGAWCMFLENVAGITSATATVVDEAEGALEERAAARVLGELADRGWHAEWLPLSASDVGASHGRARWFCFAWRELADAGHGGHGRRPTRVTKRNEARGLPSSQDPAMAHASGRNRGQQPRPDQRGLSQPDGGTACGVADTTGNGWHEGRPESGRKQGRSDVAKCGCAVADAKCISCQRRGIAGDMARTGCDFEGEAHQWQRRRPAADDCGRAMANASGQGLSQRVGGGELCDQQIERSQGPDLELYSHPLFAPGPADPRWPAIIAAAPWLSPALSIEGEHDAKAAFQAAEPLLRGTPDGLANGLDFSHRAPRLKCVGNGVVALQAAAAFVILARRSGILNQSQLATLPMAEMEPM